MMRKKITKILCALFFVATVSYGQNSADSMLQFLQTHKEKASLYLVRNDTIIAKLNEDKLMPLASVVKILVAIEFAKQVGAGLVNPQKRIALRDLDRYYIPNTDGGAHPQWLMYERSQKNISNDSIDLINVARGMMMFSSNANTEYLMELLGVDNVKNNLQLLGVKKHTSVYPIVAALFMYQNPKGKSEQEILKSLSKMSDEQYSRFIYAIHKALANDTTLKKKFKPQDLTMKMQKMWSDRLTASTVKDYAHIAGILNDRRFFDDKTYRILAEIMETVMENPANRTWLSHAGMKGGSTPWVFTKVTYATLKSKDQLELAYFFNDLEPSEQKKLLGWSNSFELAILSDPSFVKKLGEIFR